MSSEKRAPGCLDCIGDEILHSWMGIISETITSIPSLNGQLLMDN